MMLRQPLENYPITTDPQGFKNIEGLKYKLETHHQITNMGIVREFISSCERCVLNGLCALYVSRLLYEPRV